MQARSFLLAERSLLCEATSVTKADLLRALDKVPMNATISLSSDEHGVCDEEIKHVYTVTGRNGLVLQLAPSGGREPADDDAEEIYL